MPLVQVKKVVAVCFLEAAKLTLDQLGGFRLELSQQGVAGSADLPRIYGDLRRLRDFLQRCVSAYQDAVDLDLTPSDTGLLVACCRRSVEWIEQRLIDQALLADERQWLQKKRQVVADWAVELAAKPLVDLPLKRLSPTTSEGVRALTVRLQTKVFGDVRDRLKINPPTTTASMMQGIEAPMGADEQLAAQLASNSMSFGALPVAIAAEFVPPTEASVLLEHSRIRDPRLRSLAGIELNSYQRALDIGDLRLATVLLTAVLECALLDHAIPRRVELGLQGTPETWNLQELLLRAMGEQAQPKDASMAYHLFSARNMLRPALQLVTPVIVTLASFERLREFVQRALHSLGFGQPRATLPPGSLKASDFKAPAGPTN